MAHKINIYDLDRGFDENHMMRPARTVETDDPEETARIAIDEIRKTGSISAASISADWRLCPDLKSYLRLENTIANWLEENPIDGSWVGKLVEDLEFWKECGVTTAEQMHRYLLLEDYSNTYKETYGVRPRGHFSDTDSIEEIERAFDILVGNHAAVEEIDF